MIDWTRIVPAADRARADLAARRKALEAALSAHVESEARARGYDNAATFASYSGSTVREWATEAKAFMRWRDQVWQAAGPVLAAPTLPTAEELLAGLPRR